MNLTGLGAPVDIIVEEEEKFEQLEADPYLIYRKASTEGKVLYEKKRSSRRRSGKR